MPNAFVFSVAAFFGPFWSAKAAFPTRLSAFETWNEVLLDSTVKLQPGQEHSSVGEHLPRLREKYREEKGEIKTVKIGRPTGATNLDPWELPETDPTTKELAQARPSPPIP
jgi:hypothetical protein